MTARVFLSHQIVALSERYDLTVVANMQGEKDTAEWLPESVTLVDIPIRREISLFSDLKALFLLVAFFSKSGFSLVHSVTPKAGLLAMVAAWLTRVPVRIHTFTGQVWATKTGLTRTLLHTLDCLIAILTSNILVDSHSQRDFLIKNRVVRTSGSTVLGEGSISGVDTERFKPDETAKIIIRNELGADDNVTAILFVGRLNREKGVRELGDAFSQLRQDNKTVELWLVGPDEEQLGPEMEQFEGVRLVPFTTKPEHYMAAADIFCLPSYREGFGSVIIEAAACGIPSIGSDIYGLRDAIEKGKTGVLVPVQSVTELESALRHLVQDEHERQRMGEAARLRAIEKFSQPYITGQLLKMYEGLLKKVDLKGPKI